MFGLKHIELGIIENAQVRIQDLYHTNTITVSVSREVKKDTSLAHRDSVLFCFAFEGRILESVTIPVLDLVRYEEIWIPHPGDPIELYANDAFDFYSYAPVKLF